MNAAAETRSSLAPPPSLAGDVAPTDGRVEADGLPEAVAEPETLGGRGSPLRRCIVTATVAPRTGMIRFVIGPDGAVVPDVDESLPGRGLWLTADPGVVDKAVARNAFAKAARRQVRVDPDLRRRTAGLVRRRCLDLIGLARKGGGAVAGFEKVSTALRSGRIGPGGPAVGLWLEASDGAEDGRSKLAGPASAHGVPLVDAFTRAELGTALGRDEAVHAVLAAGPLVARFLRETMRLAALEGGGTPAMGMRPSPSYGRTAELSEHE